MRNSVKRTLAILLVLLFAAQAGNLFALAAESMPDTVFFEDAPLASCDGGDTFLFGSQNMRMSEKSKDTYLMKILRTGDASGEASVTLKFTDISAVYGENYVVSVYREGTVPRQVGEKTSVVGFLLDNADTQEEIAPTPNDELLDMVISAGGFDTVDAEGNTLGHTAISQGTGNGIAVDDLSSPAVIGADEASCVNDLFPGMELRLTFGSGENEKLIAVRPLYSEKAEGDCTAVITLKDPEGAVLREDLFSADLIITDEDEGEGAVLSLQSAVMTAEENVVTVTVLREGGINEMVSADLYTESGSARQGTDFQGVSATIEFPMGIVKRTVDIPVRPSESELSFNVKLLNPVNASVINGEGRAVIPPAEDGLLTLSSAYSEFDSSVGRPFTADSFSFIGNGWADRDGKINFSCEDVDYDTWNGAKLRFINPYFYDGVRITWSADHDFIFSTSYTEIKTDSGRQYWSEENEWKETTEDIIFGSERNSTLTMQSLTSYFNGLEVQVSSVQPIYRHFEFKLADADPLTYKGVSSAEARTYTAVRFAGENETTRSVKRTMGGYFAVAAPTGGNEYARLTGLEFLDKNGDLLLFIPNNDASRSIGVELTQEVLNALAVATLDYTVDTYGRHLGSVTVKPVFSYIDASVRIMPSEYGAFTGDYAVSSAAKTLNAHVGDVLPLEGTVSGAYAGVYLPDGVRYERRDADGAILPYGSGQLDFDNAGKLSFRVDCPNVTLTPVFTKNDNAVKVRVRTSDLDRFDRDSGLFKYNYGVSIEGPYTLYTLTPGPAHLDALVVLTANTARAGDVSRWTLPGSTDSYSGSTLYFTAAREAAQNVIDLSYGASADYTLKGSVYNTDKNLATGTASVNPVIPAEGALVSVGERYTQAGLDGRFVLTPAAGIPGTLLRVLVVNNNRNTYKDVYLGSDGAIDLGVITSASNTPDAASFKNVWFYQSGGLVSSTETLLLNGEELNIYAAVSDGNEYMVNGEKKTEHVTGVTFYVLDSVSNAVKYSLDAAESSPGVWSAKISHFSPENPDKYYFGDLFYVSMTTDRVMGSVTDESGAIPAQFASTEYSMLSTGYRIVNDENYKPQTVKLNLPVSAAQNSNKYNYASFPLIGSIDTVLGIKGMLVNASKENRPGESAGFDPARYRHFQFRFTVSTETLPYGGTRVKIGVTASVGNDHWAESMGYNPMEAYDFRSGRENSDKTGSLRFDDRQAKFIDQFEGSFGTPRMLFQAYLGVYLDFALIEATDLTTGQTSGLLDSNWELMGGGGFVSGHFMAEYQWPTIIPIIHVPGFVGVAGSIGAEGALGVSRDPSKVITYADLLDSENNLDLDETGFSVDLKVDGSVKGYGGVGFADYLGVRLILGFNGSFAYSPMLKKTYRYVENSWGLGAEVTVGGQVDIIVTRIPFEAFSVPLYSAGFTEYFLWLKRASELVDFVSKHLSEEAGQYDAGFGGRARTLVNTLSNDIMVDTPLAKIQSDFEALKNLVYSDSRHFITTWEYVQLYADSPYDLWLTGMSSANGEELIPHTESTWHGGDLRLSGTYSHAGSEVLVEDSYPHAQPQMLELPDGRLFAVWLYDKSASGETTKPTLVWSVYNGSGWQEPVVVQNDGTVDYSPSLCDMGDRIMISWASPDKDVTQYASASKMMEDMDIYAAFYDKSAGTVGSPERLTNDAYMDSQPKAIYDAESGSAALFYLKNAVKNSPVAEYAAAESMVCYRLYENGSWTSSYYDTEYPDASTRQMMESTYGGQRFIPDSGVGDLPINDLTVSEGYNGLGIYAYSVDMDGDAGENSDIYLRVYDFRTHKTYKPIRITDSEYQESLPQLVRNNVPYYDCTQCASPDDPGELVDGSTYLFWLEDANRIKYISVTDLIRNCIAPNGAVNTDGCTLLPVEIDTTLEDGSRSSVSSYQALTDSNNDLYVIWTDVCSDGNEDIYTPAALEIFASAKLRPATPERFDSAAKTGGTAGGSWSAPRRLTTDGHANDGLYGVAASDGGLYILHNRWQAEYVGDTEDYLAENDIVGGYLEGDPYLIDTTDLVFSSFDPAGAVAVTDIVLSDSTPCPGDEVTVTANVKNAGLTAAKGWSLAVTDSAGSSVYNTSSSEPLAAGEEREITFLWTVPSPAEGAKLIFESTESGYANTERSESEPLRAEEEYDVHINSITQSGSSFTAEMTVRNTGNVTGGSGTRLALRFAGLYGDTETVYGVSDPLLKTVSAEGIAPGSEKSFTVTFTLPQKALDYCGYDELHADMEDSDGALLSDIAREYIVLTEPMSASFQNGRSLSLMAGDSEELSVNIGSDFIGKRANILYSVDDSGVLNVDESGNLKALRPGTATVTAHILPYDTIVTLPVTVSGSIPTPQPPAPIAPAEPEQSGFTDVLPKDYFYDPVVWAVENGITEGLGKGIFGPDHACTRAQMVTFLWRAAGCPAASEKAEFVDLKPGAWYTEAVSWAAENGITKGTSPDTFSPDDTVTRAQTVTFLCRFAGGTAGDAKNIFKDVKETDYFYDSVLWAIGNGITKGTSPDTFSPDMPCTRAQIVTFLYRLITGNKQ